MKGILHKTEKGWVVKHSRLSDDGEPIGFGNYEELPLHPEQLIPQYLAYRILDFGNAKVEFEIVKVFGSESFEYAKLIPSKEQQKQLITEIMDLDAKDGLYGYDTVNELDKLAEETFKGDDATTFVQREIWKDGYKKAKETLYTEEDMKFMFESGYRKNTFRETTFEQALTFIQSLKQPKRD